MSAIAGLTPQTFWDETLARYDTALAAEMAWDAEHIDPLVPSTLQPGPARSAAVDLVPADVWSESQRLSDIRCDVEDEILGIPSPDFAAFARKVIICRDDDRDLNGLDDMLVSEARRLMAEDPAATHAPLEQCKRCRFWLEDTKCRDPHDADFGFGSCRLKPPMLIDSVVAAQLERPTWGSGHTPDDIIGTIELYRSSRYPTTFATDWCGKFERVQS